MTASIHDFRTSKELLSGYGRDAVVGWGPQFGPIFEAAFLVDAGDRFEILASLQQELSDALLERMVFERTIGNRPTADDVAILAEMDGVIVEQGAAILALAIARPDSGGRHDGRATRT
ncbi:MAG: hypothetical protein KAY22_07985 [Rhizorhabdus sp.]|uniref:hypothetical protein n=1 Tax=Rhizorhabdus sp. TaxID=1968843 RepID=UPI001B76412B|nr:hypothetical protein [Rhizorhabdus sp.]MBP8232227.1 hypothetical protein [Rhizorhabdus sp.]